MKNIKTLVLSLVVGSSLILGSTALTASAATWEDTGWIRTGVAISGTRIKRHLDYLREQVSTMMTQISSFNSQISNLNIRINNISSGLWSKNGSSAYYNSGNVGIGTASPASKLHVHNGGGLRLSGDSNIYSQDWLRIYNGGSNLHIDAAASLYLNYYSGSNVFFGNGRNGVTGVWRSNGNVGIGTTSPGNRLEVAGRIEADAYCDRNGQNCTTARNMGVTTSTYATCRGNYCTATCPSGYVRSGCVAWEGDWRWSNATSTPNGSNGCLMRDTTPQATNYAICIR